MNTILPNALSEIKISLRKQRKLSLPNSDPNIKELCGKLDCQFSTFSDELYCFTQFLPPAACLHSQDDLDSFEDSNTPRPATPEKERYIYPFPTDYIDQIFSLSQPNCLLILPYLLSVYYLNYRRNRAVDTNSKSLEKLFDSDHTYIDNYGRTLQAFCRYFSAENELSKFLKGARTDYSSAVKSCKSVEEIVSLLNNGVYGRLHYQKLLDVCIYSLCVLACVQVPELKDRIDFLLSVSLFNAHKLSFETRLCESDLYSLKDDFCYEFAAALAMVDGPIPTEDLNSPYKITPEMISVSKTSSDNELAWKIPILFSILFRSGNFPLFLSEAQLHNRLMSEGTHRSALEALDNDQLTFTGQSWDNRK